MSALSLLCAAGSALLGASSFAAETGSAAAQPTNLHNFDFFVGQWIIQNRRLKTRLSGANDWEIFPGTARAQSLLGGRVSIDEMDVPHLQLKGLGMRVFDPSSNRWSDRFLTPDGGKLEDALVGGFERGIGIFYGTTDFNGKRVKVRYIWKDITTRSFIWEQAASLDEGRTWETNWVMKFRRVR